MATQTEISAHAVLVSHALQQNASRWLSNTEIGALTKDVAARTVRMHVNKFVGLGLVEQRKVFPGHRYRWTGRNRAYAQQLARAAEALGLNIDNGARS